MPALGFEHHDHGACIDNAMRAATERCAAQGLQFTPARRRVLEILLKEHKAMGAYDILPHLADDGMSAQPPVAYRALDFLVSNGLAHKIERLNAYVACADPAAHTGGAHSPAFLICRTCGAVEEALAEADASLVGAAADRAGFTVERVVIEAEGLCPLCAKAPPA